MSTRRPHPEMHSFVTYDLKNTTVKTNKYSLQLYLIHLSLSKYIFIKYFLIQKVFEKYNRKFYLPFRSMSLYSFCSEVPACFLTPLVTLLSVLPILKTSLYSQETQLITNILGNVWNLIMPLFMCEEVIS